jgi:protoheme IX farnesyltransferase
MTRVATTPEAATTAIAPGAEARFLSGLFRNYSQLTKARLSAMVVLTSGAGFALGSGDTIRWSSMLWVMLGTALAACAANIFNELSEIDRDRRMQRTRTRPLPAGRVSQWHAMLLAVVLGSTGLIVLDIMVNTSAATLALISLVVYVAVYTPLKPRTTLNTLIGAVCGALPPMIGWVGASGQLDTGAWVLGGILYVWQLPHFFALAWMYRADYQRGGFVMLPAVDPSGELTGRVVVLTSLVLIPLGLALTLHNAAGLIYAGGSLVAGLGMLALAVRFHRSRTNIDARRVFLASIVYLPILLALMVVDRRPFVAPPAERDESAQMWLANADAVMLNVSGSGVVPAALDPSQQQANWSTAEYSKRGF